LRECGTGSHHSQTAKRDRAQIQRKHPVTLLTDFSVQGRRYAENSVENQLK
jgi:5S rRNA maturation endonuclease (ribonuclease M5)